MTDKLMVATEIKTKAIIVIRLNKDTGKQEEMGVHDAVREMDYTFNIGKATQFTYLKNLCAGDIVQNLHIAFYIKDK